MFTGIIEDVGRIVQIDDLGGGKRLTIAAAFADALTPDESVAINGACQTVVAVRDGLFEVVTIEETLRKTTFGDLTVGTPVNLERAMQANARLDGHFVMGHVDTTGTVVEVAKEKTNGLYRIQFEADFTSYLIPVGSVTVDGISLTVARLNGNTFTVAIIPHTYEHTNVSTWDAGTRVNLEFDMIGKYVVRWLEHHGPLTRDPARFISG